MRVLTISALAVGVALLVGASPASAIDVTSLSNGIGFDTWLDGTDPLINQTRNGGSATLSNEQSLDGDGALRLFSPSGSGKATALYAGSSPLGKLSSLSGLNYDYYRDPSSTNPDLQVPALRLYVSDGAGRTGTLIYEPVYNNPGSITEGSWQTVFALDGKWWLFEGGVFENFGLKLADWVTANTFNGAGGTTKTGFGANAVILGLEVGVGSGWNGLSLAYVDNIAMSFTANDRAQTTNWNFQAQQTEVPEPASLALLGAGLAGIYLARRRRRAD